MTTPHVDAQLGNEELGSAEQRLLNAAANRTLVDLRSGDVQRDDPARGTAWGAERIVRADVLIDLLTRQQPPDGGRLRAVKLRGARITGRLDLEAAELPCPLSLADCHIEQPVNLSGVSASTIRLPGCHLPGLAADRLRTTGDLDLNGLVAEGAVSLGGARIGGSLSLKAARLTNPGGYALRADALTVTESVWCRDGFIAIGEVQLAGARVGGRLSFVGARLLNPGRRALTGDGLTVEQNMTCRDGFTAEGEIRLPSACLGQLSFVSARLLNPGRRALTGDGLTIKHNLDCRDGFTAEGEVNLRGATINGTLYMSGAHLNAPGADAPSAARLTVGDDMFCRDLAVNGEVRLPGARIGGRLDLSRARLINPGATALTADRLNVDDGMLGEGLVAEGETRLPGARIGGDLVLAGARLVNPRGQAMAAARLSLDGDMSCNEGFTANGEVHLYGACSGGYIDLTGATLTNPHGQALNLASATAEGLTLLLRRPPDGVVNLTNAQIRVFIDEQETWPATLRLRGFTYEVLSNNRVDVRARLGWLARHGGGYVPALYDQLAGAYRRAGDEQAARKVAVAKQRRRRTVLGPAGKLVNWLLYLTVGYGYRTWLAAAWLAGLLALGTWVFTEAHPHDMTRIDPHAPGFNALGYTLDTLLPIVDLGQQKAWQAHGAAMYWSWAFIAAGWVLTTAVVAGLTGILKRD